MTVKDLILVQGTGSKSRSNTAYSVKLNKKKNSKNTNNSQLTVIKTKMPVTTSYKVKPKIRKISGRNNDNTIVVAVRHTEFLHDIATPDEYSGGFVLNSANLNPGLKGVFPWLSKMSLAFESYCFQSVKFTYKPATSTLTKGVIFFAATYDVASTPPEGKADILEIEGCVESTPYSMLQFNCKKGSSGLNVQKTYKIRDGAINRNYTDLRLYDCGRVYIGYSGISESGVTSKLNIGELWVEYNVEFYLPVGNTSRIQLNNIETLTCYGNSFYTPSILYPFGTRFLDRIQGKFKDAGLKLVENNKGYLLETAKTIAKSIWTSVSGTIGAPLPLLLELFKYTDVDENDEDGLSIIDQDAGEHLELVTNGDSRMKLVTDPVTDIDGKHYASGITIQFTDFNNTSKIRTTKYLVNMVAGDVLRMTGAGSEVPINSHFEMTDRIIKNNNAYQSDEVFFINI